jgi:imidazolonepropionase-like amidohydrolase
MPVRVHAPAMMEIDSTIDAVVFAPANLVLHPRAMRAAHALLCLIAELPCPTPPRHMKPSMSPVLLSLVTCALLAQSAPAQSSSAPADTLRYTFLSASRPSGLMKVWTSAGERHVFFEFNDRGRGPRTTTRMMLDEKGVPTRVDIAGHDYLKSPVDERFAVERGTATWKNPAEAGSAPARGAFYATFNGPPEEIAVLARALLKAPGRTLALLPAGEARIDRVGDLALSANGEQRRVTQYAISGMGFSPWRLWLDERNDFFASGGNWSMTIRQKWESAQAELVEAQNADDAKRAGQLAAKLARKPRGPLVFKNAMVLDAERARMVARTTVVITGNRITAVGPDGSVPEPAGATVIDATGKSLLPGLWDMHVHVGDDDGLFHLAAGVTTVRDLANDTDELLARRKKFDAGTLLGPRLILGGFMDGPGPFAGPTKVLVSTTEEARAAVDKYASLGYEQIKVYSSIKPELVPAIVEAAHAKGMRVSGHIPAHMTAEQAVRAGFDEIQHANMLFLNFLGDTLDTRTPLRFTAVGQHGALLDLGADSVQRFVRLLKERNVLLDPTLNVFENLFVARKGVVDPGYVAVADRLPPQVRRGLLSGGLPVDESTDRRYRESFANMLRLVKMMHDAGIMIVPGTDAFAGFALHRELELYVEAGIPAAEVLRIATLVPARVTKRDKELGSIVPGKLADLVLVEGNPAERISDIRRSTLVVKDGVMYVPDELYQAVGVWPKARKQ